MELVKCCKVPYSELVTSGVLVHPLEGNRHLSYLQNIYRGRCIPS